MPDPIKQPTLTELDNPDPNFIKPEPKPIDLTEEAQRQAAEAEAARIAAEAQAAADATASARLAELEAKPADQLSDAEKAELVTLKGEGDADPNGDGDPNADDSTFWEDVDKLRGEKIEIDWSAHKDASGEPIDPLSAEGVLIREKKIEELAITKFEAHLSKDDPRAYAYFLHRRTGGSDDAFFATKTVSLPEYNTFTNSVDLQQKVYHDDLLRKGVSEKQAKMLVDEAVKDKEIFELADKAYKAQEKEHADGLKAIEAQLAADEAAYQQSLQTLDTMLTTEITAGGTMKMFVPEAKRVEFNQFVRDRIQVANGQFFAAQVIDKNSLPRILEGLYLQFVNGDLSGIVQRRAKTQTARTLRDRVAAAKPKPAAGDPPAGGKRTLAEI